MAEDKAVTCGNCGDQWFPTERLYRLAKAKGRPDEWEPARCPRCVWDVLENMDLDDDETGGEG